MTEQRQSVQAAVMKWPILLTISVLAAGCVAHHHLQSYAEEHRASSTRANTRVDTNWWTLEYHSRDGEAILENQFVTLIFAGISPAQQRAFHFNGGKQQVQVNGDGQSRDSVSCRQNAALIAFEASYAQGTNTLRFGPGMVRITDGGRTLLANGESIPLSKAPAVVRVKKGVD